MYLLRITQTTHFTFVRYNIIYKYYIIHICPRVLYHRYIMYLIIRNIPACCTDRNICVYNTNCYIVIELYGRVVTQRSIDKIDVILFGIH